MKQLYVGLVCLVSFFMIACGKVPEVSSPPSPEIQKPDISPTIAPTLSPTITPTLPPNYIYQKKADGTYEAVRVQRIDAKTVLPKGDGTSMLDYKIDDRPYFNETELWWMLDSQKEVRFPSYAETASSMKEYSLSELQKLDSLGLIFSATYFSLTSGISTGTLKTDLSTGIKPEFVKVQKNRGYFAYRFEDGYRLFKFFYVDTFGNMRYTGYPILVKKSLGLNDFINIKIGDTIDDVAEIDPVASIYKQIYDQYPNSSLVLQKGEEQGLKLRVFSCHLCRDCAIEYIYTRDSDGQYRIVDIWKDGHFTLYTGEINASWSFGAKVFPEDYPNE